MSLGHGSANQVNAKPVKQGPTNATQVSISPQSPPINTNTSLNSIGGSSIVLGQTTESASFPVVIASNQSSLITQPNVSFFVSATVSTTGATSVLILPAVTSKSIYITSFSLSNSSATAVLVNFQDGSGGSVLTSNIVPAGMTIALGSNNPLFKTASGNGLYFQSSGAVTTLYANVSGFVL